MTLAIHVADEALTDFLGVYNPTVAELQARYPWLPMPQFEFGPWLGLLALAVVILLALSPFAFRGAWGLRPVAYAFVVVMLLNAAGHTLGTVLGRTVESVRFAWPMPGFYSSPLVFVAALYLLYRLQKTRRRVEIRS